MERKFYPENFEYFLKGHADNFRMTPSKKVWHGIYNDLYPGRRWPSIAMSMVFIFTLVVIGHLNTTNSHNTPLSNVAYTNNLATFSSTKQKTKSTPVNRTLTYINTDTDIAAVNILFKQHQFFSDSRLIFEPLFRSAVLMLVTKILISSSVSVASDSTRSGFISGTRCTNRSQRRLSRSSFKQIRSLCRKSLADSAACASP